MKVAMSSFLESPGFLQSNFSSWKRKWFKINFFSQHHKNLQLRVEGESSSNSYYELTLEPGILFQPLYTDSKFDFMESGLLFQANRQKCSLVICCHHPQKVLLALISDTKSSCQVQKLILDLYKLSQRASTNKPFALLSEIALTHFDHTCLSDSNLTKNIKFVVMGIFIVIPHGVWNKIQMLNIYF